MHMLYPKPYTTSLQGMTERILYTLYPVQATKTKWFSVMYPNLIFAASLNKAHVEYPVILWFHYDKHPQIP